MALHGADQRTAGAHQGLAEAATTLGGTQGGGSSGLAGNTIIQDMSQPGLVLGAGLGGGGGDGVLGRGRGAARPLSTRQNRPGSGGAENGN